MKPHRINDDIKIRIYNDSRMHDLLSQLTGADGCKHLFFNYCSNKKEFFNYDSTGDKIADQRFLKILLLDFLSKKVKIPKSLVIEFSKLSAHSKFDRRSYRLKMKKIHFFGGFTIF